MSHTIQKKIRMYYSLWLFLIFIFIAGYVLLTGKVFMEYSDALPWIYRYIVLALLGNIGALVAVYYYLPKNSNNLKLLIVYEALFVLILVFTCLVITKEWVPAAIGNLNFESLLNAVLPISFIFIMLIEFIFSKAIRQMP